MRYIIYTRVSTRKQTVENQIKECREYVYKMTQKNDEVKEFAEPDSSTQKPMHLRKKLIEMMNDLRSGDKLIIYKVDRLARDPQELINIYCDIRKKGVDIVGLHDPSLNTETICIYAFIAASERKNIRTRTITGLSLKKSKKERVGTVLYGCKLDESKLQTYREDVNSYNKPYLLITNNQEHEQIELMKQLYSQGYSYGEITKELKDRGYQNRKGKPVHKMSVSRIMRRLGIKPPTRNPAPMVQCAG